jgi:8-oxo-dGTP pyrophosphatase MutT (NUDIX family)
LAALFYARNWQSVPKSRAPKNVPVLLNQNATDECVLCGKRSENKLICGPGGNIQEGETPAQAAIRETQEEFGITPLNLKRVGQITEFEGGKYGEPIIYLCTEREGEPKASKEIRNPDFSRWTSSSQKNWSFSHRLPRA